MADEDDPSDLFAVPDLWRPSSWLDQSIKDINRQNPLFALDVPVPVPDRPSLTVTPRRLVPSPEVPLLETSDGVDDTDAFFKIPSLLKELVGPNSLAHDQNLIGAPEPVLRLEPAPDSGTEPSSEDDDDDFWISSNDLESRPQYRTWENFEQDGKPSAAQSPLFITEAGAEAFDALFAPRQPSGEIIPDILDAATYCGCLLSLALGRSSILFAWDANKNSFVKTTPYLRISGLSLDSINAIDSLCLDCGNAAKHLQTFAEVTSSRAATPTRVALAGVVDRLVTVVRSELNARAREVKSVLQLQDVVQPTQSLLSYFKRLVKKLAQQKTDEGVLSVLFEEAQACEYRDGLLGGVTQEVLRILSQPWLEFVQEWLGLRPEEGLGMSKQGPGKGFVKVADKMCTDDQGYQFGESDYFLDEDKVPMFVSEDMAQTIFETGRNLRFLREHHPEHPLSRPDVIVSAMPPRLKWEFDWAAISKLEARVNKYRDAVSRAIEGRHRVVQSPTKLKETAEKEPDNADVFNCFGQTETQMETTILASIRKLDQLPEDRNSQDKLTVLLRNQLYQNLDSPPDSGNLSPHWSLIPLLSFGPAIDAQASLINQECMKLLFTAHHLRTHIDLLKQSFLLANGVLCSRLSHALFDPDLESAERKKGVTLGGRGTMGLRLGGRRTWPPASSELRLALMGVLAECYEPPRPLPPPSSSSSLPLSSHSTPSRKRPRPSSSYSSSSKSSPWDAHPTSLPGDLSFAVRALSPEEIDRCLSDPDTLEALDFLRLSYRPPATLRAVISPGVLVKYDNIFKLLLRVLRMVWVGDALWLEARNAEKGMEMGRGGEGSGGNAAKRFVIEARHFIRQVAAYFFRVGVGACWKRFEAWLDRVEADCLDNRRLPGQAAGDGGGDGDGDKKGVVVCSPDVLRERQEQALDEAMAVLLLRRRQAPVLALLEEVFAVVLRFAKGLRGGFGGGGNAAGAGEEGWENGEREQSPEELYAVFRKKVEVFVTVCKGLGEKMGKGEENTVEQLLVMLDMGGFYSRGTKRAAPMAG